MDERRRLAEDRRSTLARIAALERDLAVLFDATADAPDDEHDPEGATIGFERAQVTALLEAGRRHLAELDAARTRRVAGRYGICETCGGRIAPDRLEALPATRLCIACAARAPR